MREHYEWQILAKYYTRDHFYDFLDFFKDVPREAAVINFGCGRGECLNEFPEGIGVDFNRNLIPLWVELGVREKCFAFEAHKVPWKDNRFEWSISTDFLEHVQPDSIEPTLEAMFRLAPHGKHVIHLLKQSGFRGPKGENLHVSALNILAWAKHFQGKASTFKQRGSYLFISW